MLEIIILLCIRMFATHPVSHSVHSVALRKLIAAAVLFGGPMSIGFAFAGIFLDSCRAAAFFAALAAVGCWIFCFLQTLA